MPWLHCPSWNPFFSRALSSVSPLTTSYPLLFLNQYTLVSFLSWSDPVFPVQDAVGLHLSLNVESAPLPSSCLNNMLELQLVSETLDKHNVLMALESVSVVVMRWYNSHFSVVSFDRAHIFFSFATHAHCFIDAYAKGLQGKGAAWAAKKYCGHSSAQVYFTKFWWCCEGLKLLYFECLFFLFIGYTLLLLMLP